MWVNPADLTPNRSLFGNNATKNYMNYSSSGETRYFSFETDTGGTNHQIDCGVGNIQKDKWIMYTFIWNADRTVDVYLNGALSGSSSATADTTADKKIVITKFGAGHSQNWFNGAMTEISHYTDILTQAEINDLFNDGKAKSALDASGSVGLSAYWRNNGLAQWDDLKGSNNGTVTATETLLIPAGVDSSRDTQGFIMNRQRATSSLNYEDASKSADSADTATYVEVLRNSTIDNLYSGGGSFSCWIYPHSDGESNIGRIYNKLSYYFATTNQQANGTMSITGEIGRSGNNGIWVTDYSINSNAWNNIIFTYNSDAAANNPIYYINGAKKEVGSGVTEGSPAPDNDTVGSDVANNLIIGNYSSTQANRQFDGQIDDILLYTKILSDDEATRIYNAGKRSHRNG
jgi:hypothetical protein